MHISVGLIIKFFFVLCLSSQVLAQKTCPSYFNQLIGETEYDGLPYYRVLDREIHQNELIPVGAFGVGIYGSGHVSIFINGYRIDGFGLPGFLVRSKFKVAEKIKPDLLFVFNNPPKGLVTSLIEDAEKEKSVSSLSCVGVACRHLIPNSNGELIQESTIWPSIFVEMLIDLAKENSSLEVDTYTFDGVELESFVRLLKTSAQVEQHSVLGRAALILLITSSGLFTIF